MFWGLWVPPAATLAQLPLLARPTPKLSTLPANWREQTKAFRASLALQEETCKHIGVRGEYLHSNVRVFHFCTLF